MRETEHLALPATTRVPWNKGKLIGARPPLRPKHVWAIRTKLQMEKQIRGLALFSCSILQSTASFAGATLSPSRSMTLPPMAMPSIELPCVSGRPAARSALSWQTRQAVDDYIRLVGKKSGEFLFTVAGRVRA